MTKSVNIAKTDKKVLEDSQIAFRQMLGAIDAGKMVFFSGAGVSTESGIPDFRSAGGVFSKVKGLTPEIMLSREYASTHQDEFFNFYQTGREDPPTSGTATPVQVGDKSPLDNKFNIKKTP